MPSFSHAVPETPTRIVLPRPPENSEPHPFPWLATVAPVMGSVGLWAITQSVYALAFAALGPLIAVASVGDARLSSRRARRIQRARFDRECARARDTIVQAHARERADLARRAPGARSLLAASIPDPERWRGSVAGPVVVRLGVGSVMSSLEVDGGADDGGRGELDTLRGAAATLRSAPVLVDARLGIGLYGPQPLVVAAARAVVMQLAAALSPVSAQVDGPPDWGWLSELPHQGTASRGEPARAVVLHPVDRVVFSDGSDATSTITVAMASTSSALPRQARVVVSVGAAGSVITTHPEAGGCGPLLSEFVSQREASVWACAQAELAHAEGFAPKHGDPPETVSLRETLERAAAAGPQPSLRCAIGLGGEGVVFLDLVEDGPHAIVGGTTGSGKSELLISWVIAMAAARSPSDVTFLFVDFKGGAAFEPLRSLPHSVGMITDLDEYTAERALSSLSAEVRHRERLLAAAGARSIDDFAADTPLPRLVIVVDEYATMLDENPGLHTLFADLAARGRSLGIHLVLCTQRPNGVVRDNILANCGLRLCLRVNNAPDSISVVGSNAAALLPASPRGRAVARIHGGATHLVQVAHTSESDIRTVADLFAGHPRPRAPWCAPLPAHLKGSELGELMPQHNLPFALVDLPREQRQEVARFDPALHGNLLVVGAGASGKTSLLETLWATPSLLETVAVLPQLAAVWDAAQRALAHAGPPRVLLLDNVDAIVQACPEEYSAALTDLLTRLLREGPARGVSSVLTAQRLPGSMHALAALCGPPLLLRTPSRQEHLLAGGDSGDWQPDLPPGAGVWRGNRLQIARMVAPDKSRHTPIEFSAPTPGIPLVVISTRPRAMAERLRTARPHQRLVPLGGGASGDDTSTLLVSHGNEGSIVIGDPDAWLAHWGMLAVVRETAELIFDGCSMGEFRSLTGIRELPPPGALGERPLWLLRRDGSVHRAVLELPQPWIPHKNTHIVD